MSSAMITRELNDVVRLVVNQIAVNYNLSDLQRKKIVLESDDMLIMYSVLESSLLHKIARRIEHWAYADKDYFEQDPEVLNDYKIG